MPVFTRTTNETRQMNKEAAFRAALGRRVREFAVCFFFGRAAEKRPPAVGNRRHRAAADPQTLGNLPLRQLPIFQEPIDFFDDG